MIQINQKKTVSSTDLFKTETFHSPGRAGTFSRTFGATAPETLTETSVEKPAGSLRATLHLEESSASQTTGFPGVTLPEFTSVGLQREGTNSMKRNPTAPVLLLARRSMMDWKPVSAAKLHQVSGRCKLQLSLYI